MRDELQGLWQGDDNAQKENGTMWMELVEEKRRGFHDLMRAENRAEYLVTVILAPVLALVAWKAKFAWTRAGYGLLAATFIMLAIAVWVDQRQWPRMADRSLREQLEALLGSYDRRVRFLGIGKLCVSVSLAGGLVAVCMGIPGAVTSARAWTVTLSLLVFLGVAQWRSYLGARASIGQKRDETARLLSELVLREPE